jgi:hypothetical protein
VSANPFASVFVHLLVSKAKKKIVGSRSPDRP